MKDMAEKWREKSDAACDAAREAFPGHYVDTMPDPEDDGLFYVRVFGVPDDGTYPAQVKLADALSGVHTDSVDLVFAPFVVSMADTVAFYPEFMPFPPAAEGAVIDPDVLGILHDVVMTTPIRLQEPEQCMPRFGTHLGGFCDGSEVPYAA